MSRRLPWGAAARMTGRRALAAVPVLLAVTFAVFAVAEASPFDPVKAYAGTAGLTASQENLDQLRANLGADLPLLTRWWEWLTAALTGDLGDSAVMRRPVADVIGERLGWSVLLAVTAFLIALALGTLLGVLAGRRRGGLLDRAVSSAAYTLEAAPAFWLGLLAVWFFALELGVLPAGGLTDTASDTVTAGQVARHLVLPALVLGNSQLPWFFLYVRQGVGDALDEDPVRGARARGLSERTVLTGHALRSGMLPVLTLVGSRVPELITGALLVETVFSWPGIAAATVTAATSVDFPLLAALTVLATGAVLLGNLLSDLLYGLAAGYDRRAPVFRGASLTVAPGESLGLLGPSGCGKSTLARVAALLHRPDAGRLVLDGTEVRAWRHRAPREQRTAVGVVFQQPRTAADPRLTLADLIAEPLRAGRRRAEVPGRLAALAPAVGLTPDLLARRPHEVSDGQLQRACLARALILRPRWLICDEMTAMLDASTTAALVAAVEAYRAETGAGLLAVGHDRTLLHRWCDRTVEWRDCLPAEEHP